MAVTNLERVYGLDGVPSKPSVPKWGNVGCDGTHYFINESLGVCYMCAKPLPVVTGTVLAHWVIVCSEDCKNNARFVGALNGLTMRRIHPTQDDVWILNFKD